MYKGRIAAAWNTLNRNKGEGVHGTNRLKKLTEFWLGKGNGETGEEPKEDKPKNTEKKNGYKGGSESELEVSKTGEELKPTGEEVTVGAEAAGEEVTVGAEAAGEGKIRSEGCGNPGSGGKKDGGDGKSDPTEGEGGEGISCLKKLGEFWHGKGTGETGAETGEDGKNTGSGSSEKNSTGSGGDKKMDEVLRAASNLMLASASFDTAMKAIGAGVWVGRKGLSEGAVDVGKSSIGLDSREDSANIKDLMTAVQLLAKDLAKVDAKTEDANWKLDLLLPKDAPKRPKPTPTATPTEQPTPSSEELPPTTPSSDDSDDSPSFEDVC